MFLTTYIKPFDVTQLIYVMTNEYDTEEVRVSNLTDLADTVIQLLAEYAVDRIEIHGPEVFCEKAKDDIAKAELTKYNNNQLKIELKGE